VTTRSRAGIVRRQRRDEDNPLKIVVTGPFSAGKTTFIQTISEDGFLATDRAVTDASRARKTQTTVAMDFGKLTFGDDLSLQLVGTPGQDRFEVMWEILSRGMIGFILLVDASAPDGLEEAAQILGRFQGFRGVPFVVAVSHLDDRSADPSRTLDEIRRGLGVARGVPVGPCDPRVKEDVKAALLQLLGLILAGAARPSAATG
jgi:signal recognition particle receptor subunit beta